MTPDPELLANFARTNSEDAFAELVRRHVNLVYSAALRQVNADEHLAKDVAQTVFTDLARKADSLARRESLTGWLYTSAHFAAAKIVRGETRRRDREEKFMREPTNEPDEAGRVIPCIPDAEWEKLRPALDAAMHELKSADREAILLRYFENRPFAEVGAKLGLNENAARMRVERALEKLRAGFAKRGVTATATLAAVISANAVQLAPAGLSATLTTASIATAGTGTITLLKIVTATPLKLGVSALVVAGTATALMVQHQTQEKLRDENGLMRQQIAQLQTENENFSNQLAGAGNSKGLKEDQLNELLKLRGEIGVLRSQAGQAGKLREENQRLRAENSAGRTPSVQISPQDQFQLQEWHTINTMKYVGLAMRIYSGDHNDALVTNFDQITQAKLYDTNSLGSVSLDNLEFMNVGLLSYAQPEMIMFREKNPRQTLNGKWVREYGWVDGSVQTIYSDNGNFDDYEKQHSPPPASQ
jgi:RNA polymerase sigma factor (sigma-70 family)